MSGRGGPPPKLTETRLAPFPAERFERWLAWAREYRGWSRAESARRLGCEKDTPAAWMRNGAPGYVGLACAALARGMGPWEPPGRRVDVVALRDHFRDGMTMVDGLDAACGDDEALRAEGEALWREWEARR